MSGLGLKVVVTCCIALLVASLAGTIMYAIREDAKRITLNKDQSAARCSDRLSLRPTGASPWLSAH